MQIDMNDVRVDFSVLQTRWTIYNKISRSFDTFQQSGSMSGSESQHKNKDKAFMFYVPVCTNITKNKLKMLQNVRLRLVLDRSNKIRTYNYAQGRNGSQRI
jgi:hypothetical protein